MQILAAAFCCYSSAFIYFSFYYEDICAGVVFEAAVAAAVVPIISSQKSVQKIFLIKKLKSWAEKIKYIKLQKKVQSFELFKISVIIFYRIVTQWSLAASVDTFDDADDNDDTDDNDVTDETDDHLTNTFLEKPQYDRIDYKTKSGDDSMKLLWLVDFW